MLLEKMHGKFLKQKASDTPMFLRQRGYSYSSNQPLTVKGAFTCEVSIGKKTEQAEFIVIRGSG